MLDGRDLERKGLGLGRVGLQEKIFLTGPCLHRLGQDQGQGWQAAQLEEAQQGHWRPGRLSLIWVYYSFAFQPERSHSSVTPLQPPCS